MLKPFYVYVLNKKKILYIEPSEASMKCWIGWMLYGEKYFFFLLLFLLFLYHIFIYKIHYLLYVYKLTCFTKFSHILELYLWYNHEVLKAFTF